MNGNSTTNSMHAISVRELEICGDKHSRFHETVTRFVDIGDWDVRGVLSIIGASRINYVRERHHPHNGLPSMLPSNSVCATLE